MHGHDRQQVSAAVRWLTSLLIAPLSRLVTKQTPPGGVPVSKVMVAEAIDITRETYFCIMMDRESNGPVIIASPDGGVDIEEVAEKTPERIKKMPVDIHSGVTPAMAAEVAEFLGFTGPLVAQCAEQIQSLYKTFLTVDCLQLEINPLAETPQGVVSRFNLIDEAPRVAKVSSLLITFCCYF